MKLFGCVCLAVCCCAGSINYEAQAKKGGFSCFLRGMFSLYQECFSPSYVFIARLVHGSTAFLSSTKECDDWIEDNTLSKISETTKNDLQALSLQLGGPNLSSYTVVLGTHGHFLLTEANRAYAFFHGVIVFERDFFMDNLYGMPEQQAMLIAIVAHEVAHIHGWHAPVRRISLIGAATVVDVLFCQSKYGQIDSERDSLHKLFLSACARWALSTGAGLCVEAAVSRELERRADEAVKDYPALARGLMRYLQLLAPYESNNDFLASHPPIAERIALLAQWAEGVG